MHVLLKVGFEVAERTSFNELSVVCLSKSIGTMRSPHGSRL